MRRRLTIVLKTLDAQICEDKSSFLKMTRSGNADDNLQ